MTHPPVRKTRDFLGTPAETPQEIPLDVSGEPLADEQDA